MVQTYNPPLMDVNADTPPELQPVFTLLNSHSNKLYQEGYFLKLDDQNTLGKPNPDRTWTECFAQLVGTVLSLWDAAELDAAGEDGEVLPKFINLTDASIKMVSPQTALHASLLTTNRLSRYLHVPVMSSLYKTSSASPPPAGIDICCTSTRIMRWSSGLPVSDLPSTSTLPCRRPTPVP
jgi:hypothetical protein